MPGAAWVRDMQAVFADAQQLSEDVWVCICNLQYTLGVRGMRSEHNLIYLAVIVEEEYKYSTNVHNITGL